MKRQGFKINIENIKNNAIIALNEDSKKLFPTVNKTVFISHSHKDCKIAKCLKDQLEDNGVSVFVDFEVWRHMKDIVSKEGIGEEEVKKQLILSLKQQITKSPFFIFIQSQSSIDEGMDETSSEYIYEELRASGSLIVTEGYKVHTYLENLTKVKDVQDLLDRISETSQNL